MRDYRLLAVLLTTAVLAMSCGGGDDDGKSKSTSTTLTDTTTTTAPVSTDPAMLEKAKAAVLQAGDFPAGWVAQPAEEGLDLEITWRDIIDCLGVEAKPALGVATSPTFLRDLATQARATVEYTTELTAKAVGAALAGPKFPDCAKKAFASDAARSAPEGGVPGPVTVTPLDFPQLGQATSATRITFNVNLDELQVPITQDLLVFFKGATMIRTTFLNPGGPFPQDLQRSLAEAVVGRA